MTGFRRLSKGFTIVELLIVITIILLIIATTSIGIYNARRSNRDSRRMSDALLISRAIDQYVTINRGRYPVGSEATQNQMCTSDILNLDSTIFPRNVIPTDPLPVNATTACPSVLRTYVYHTEYNHDTLSSLASIQNVSYSIEVALEGQPGADESNFRPPSAFTTLTNASVSTTYPDTITATGGVRYRYILNGPSCGTLCYK